MYLFLFLGFVFGFLGYYSGDSGLTINLHDSYYVFKNSIVFNYLSIYFFIICGIYFFLKKNKMSIKSLIKFIHIALTLISFGIYFYLFFSILGFQSNDNLAQINSYTLIAQIIFVTAQTIFGFGIYKSLKNNTLP